MSASLPKCALESSIGNTLDPDRNRASRPPAVNLSPIGFPNRTASEKGTIFYESIAYAETTHGLRRISGSPPRRLGRNSSERRSDPAPQNKAGLDTNRNFRPDGFRFIKRNGLSPRQEKKIKSFTLPHSPFHCIHKQNRIPKTTVSTSRIPHPRPAAYCFPLPEIASHCRPTNTCDEDHHSALSLPPSGKAPGQTNNNKATAPYERFCDYTARNTD